MMQFGRCKMVLSKCFRNEVAIQIASQEICALPSNFLEKAFSQKGSQLPALSEANQLGLALCYHQFQRFLPTGKACMERKRADYSNNFIGSKRINKILGETNRSSHEGFLFSLGERNRSQATLH